MTPRERLEFVVEAWEDLRPTEWIARSLGRTSSEIAHTLRVAGLKPRNFRGGLDRYDQMESFILDGMSHSEIARTLGCDHRTLETWFPGTGWEAGGWAHTAAELIRQVNQDLNRIDKHGNMSERRNRR